MNRIQELDEAIEALKDQLRQYLDEGKDLSQIYELNHKIDGFIVEYYRLVQEKE